MVQKLSIRGLAPPPIPSLKEEKIARPRITDPLKKSEAFRVRLTVEERATIEAKADKVGLSVSDYVRRCALSRKLPQPPAHGIDFEAKQELRRIGVNLNQITKAMNARGQVAPSSLASVTDQLEAIFDVIYADVSEDW